MYSLNWKIEGFNFFKKKQIIIVGTVDSSSPSSLSSLITSVSEVSESGFHFSCFVVVFVCEIGFQIFQFMIELRSNLRINAEKESIQITSQILRILNSFEDSCLACSLFNDQKVIHKPSECKLRMGRCLRCSEKGHGVKECPMKIQHQNVVCFNCSFPERVGQVEIHPPGQIQEGKCRIVLRQIREVTILAYQMGFLPDYMSMTTSVVFSSLFDRRDLFHLPLGARIFLGLWNKKPLIIIKTIGIYYFLLI